VTLPVAAEIRLIHNGNEASRTMLQVLTFRPHRPGVYRVEAWLKGRPWILSNPIYLRE